MSKFFGTPHLIYELGVGNRAKSNQLTIKYLQDPSFQTCVSTCDRFPTPCQTARFSVCTETAYNGRAGGIIVDCTWFSVSAFESANSRCLDQLGKGKVVRVLGRVRVQRYTDGNGAERSCWEIIAHEVEVKEDRV